MAYIEMTSEHRHNVCTCHNISASHYIYNDNDDDDEDDDFDDGDDDNITRRSINQTWNDGMSTC